MSFHLLEQPTRALAFAFVLAIPNGRVAAQGGAIASSPDSAKKPSHALADTVHRRHAPYVIGRVDSTRLGDVPGVSALGGLAGKISAVHVLAPSGDPALAPRIRLRGSTVLDGAQDPLVVVDGMITDAPLSDLSAEDLDRIEVLKGPAAAALYGSEGAKGVVLISTRRGDAVPDGSFQVRLRNEVGPSIRPRGPPVAQAHAYRITTAPDGSVEFVRDSAGKRILEADHIADNPYPRVFDQQAELYRTGLFFTNHLALSGRRRGTSIYAGLENTHDEGVVFALDGFRRQNARVNLDQVFPAGLTFSMSGFYGHSDDGTTEEGVGSPFFAVRFLEPYVDLRAPNPDGTPYAARIPDNEVNASNPLYNLANERRSAVRRRLMGGARLSWEPVRWLRAEGHITVDRARDSSSDLRPATYLNVNGNPTGGFLARSLAIDRRYDTGGELVANAGPPGARIAFRAAYWYQDFHTSTAESFSAPPGGPVATSEATTRSSAHAMLAAAGLTLADRLILDGAVRRDRLSFLPVDSTSQWNYRIAGRWDANRDLRLTAFDEIELHAAYGTAGVRPDLGLLLAAVAPAGGASTPARLLRSGELEIGADLETSGGRFALEYAWSRRNARDQRTLTLLPPSGGFLEEFINAGALYSTTHELTLGYTVLKRPTASWTLTVVGDRIRQRISAWPLAERLRGFGQQPALVYFAGGQPYGVMYGTRTVRRIEELYDDPAKKALSGPGQRFAPDSLVVNEEGFVVLRAAWHTPAEQPIRYVTCRLRAADGSCSTTTSVFRIGDANPDFNAGFGSSLTLGRMSASVLVDWSQGGSLYNGALQWSLLGARDPIVDQRGKPEAAKKSLDYYGFFYNGLNPIDVFVESATYVKVRELALSYTFRGAQLGSIGLGSVAGLRVGLVGRNLFTFTKYSGYDPEVSSLAGDPFVYRVDWFNYPPFRTVTGMVEITF